MLLYDILDQNKKQIKFLGKSEQNIETAKTLITELKKHNIRVKDLEKAIENEQDEYRKVKLQDVYYIYKEFEKAIEDRYLDENDVLTICYEKLDQTNMFENALIYIDEFVGFTPQEYKIVEKLSKCGKQVTITVTTDQLNITKNPEEDIFYTNKKTVEKLINLPNVQIEKSVYLDKIYRFKSKELAHIEQNIYAVPYKRYNEEVKDIKLFLAMNRYQEVENIASNILELVRDKGYRFSEISMITKEIDSYSSLIKAIFKEYDIPVFIDEKADLGQNILVKYIISILDIFAKNWSYEAVFNYIKTDLCDIEIKEQFMLENYCLRFGIKGKKWYQEDWKFVLPEEDAKMNVLRRKIVEPLMEFYNILKDKKNVKEITIEIYNFLLKMNIDKKIQEKKDKLEAIGKLELANLYGVSWNVLVELLDEIILVFGEKNINFDKYSKILQIGIKESDLGKIPPTSDQVTFGDVERSRSHKVKAIFILGLNDGSFPSIRKEEGFLDDNDRENLKEKGIELAKGTTESLYEDNFNIYKALTTAEEKLFLSYASTDSQSNALRPSILISKIKKIFPELKEESDANVKTEKVDTLQSTFNEMLLKINELEENNIDEKWIHLLDYYLSLPSWRQKTENALQALKYRNNPDNITKENIEKMYGNTLRTSVSRLEQYRTCPFSFYLKYGLNLKEKRTFKIESLDTGSFMHDVIDQFFREVRVKNLKLDEISQEQIEKIIEEIIKIKLELPQNYIFTSTPKFRVLTKRLKRLLIKSIKYIIQTLTLSDFEILGTEVEFKEGKHFSPIEYILEDGRKVEVTGKIDRIDFAKDDKNRYLRIIDYKSSVKSIDLNEVLAGVQLQLLTYLDAITKNKEDIPAGILYFNLIDEITKIDSKLSAEDIENEIKKKFKMQGYVLADLKVVKMMDKVVGIKENSNIIPIHIDTKGNLSNSSNVLTKEQFEDLQKYVNYTIKQIAKEILEGEIPIKPYYGVKKKKTPCKLCSYKEICQFDSSNKDNTYKYIQNLEKQVVLEKIREKNNNK